MSSVEQSARGNWGSKIAFIFAASGSAIGLGSIWRFPLMVGLNGGAIFVFAYILAVFFIGFPVMLAELTIGRHTERNPVGAFKAIKPGTPWKLVGYMGVLTGVFILSYYSVVAGWAFGYFYKTLFGVFRGEVTWELSDHIFSSFAANPLEVLFCLLIIIGLTTFVISKGVKGGIERWSKILMPLLFALIIFLAIRALTLPGAGKGLAFYLKPELTKINPKVLFFAVGQAFFSLSLGMGTMMTYGSYISKRENLVSSAGWVCFSTTLVAFLAGIIIFPTLSATNNLEGLQVGTGLMFQVFPLIISKLPGGYIFGLFFFVLLLVAALTSTISLLEVPTAFLVDEHNWKREKAALIVGGAAFILGIPSALSNGALPWITKTNFMMKMDLIFGNIMLAVGGLFITIFLAYSWGVDKALQEISSGNKSFRLKPLWIFNIKFLAPLAIILILVFIRILIQQ
ncbi:MAG: sodium-dependent transporter [Candidatus Aminicenantes bacterium 4484_214]|nr:MAG: sodium-dependent transporter [Candidatus Aminicenantes bacterium 4484_214]RLE07534.1 MAG: sodium-dependent transporter [Candidatus Aminicenantes bacterium]